MNKPSKRDLLIASAVELFHQNGYETTSLADIAARAGVPVGNMYYYFKTKEALGLAVAKEQLDQMHASLSELDTRFDEPLERIKHATGFYSQVADIYAKHGCPVATVCMALDTKSDNVGKAFSRIYAAYVQWMTHQFQRLGFDATTAENNALHILAQIQGSALLAKCFANPDILKDEIRMVLESLDHSKTPQAA